MPLRAILIPRAFFFTTIVRQRSTEYSAIQCRIEYVHPGTHLGLGVMRINCCLFDVWDVGVRKKVWVARKEVWCLVGADGWS